MSRSGILLGLSAAGTVFVSQLAVAESRVFTPQDIIQWERQSFEGETHYELVEKDGREVLYARCDQATASGLFLEEPIDIAETPILEWEWRVANTFTDLDETTKAGDDYPARLYAVDAHRVARWRTRALNYVWASEMPEGSDWGNAYQSRARMIAVQSGLSQENSGWQTQRRDLRQDFKTYHDRDLDQVTALAIMTDCDDTGQTTEAWYGEIRLLSE